MQKVSENDMEKGIPEIPESLAAEDARFELARA